MSGRVVTVVLAAAFLAFARPAAAAEVDVTDPHGHPLRDAVVELQSAVSGPTSAPRMPPAESVIAQRQETFLPLVTLIRKGGRVIFTNNDTTMHQVYSFSPIKQFAFEIDEGQRSEPVIFDKPGVAAIGCNIHDQMITYVYVAEQPWASLSDGSGRAIFSNLPDGTYHGSIWHPQQPAGAPPASFSLVVTDDKTRASVAVAINAVSEKKTLHMQMY